MVEDVLEKLDKLGIKWINLQFTDVVGVFRQVTVSRELLTPKAFEDGLGKLDGSSVKGFTGIEESDLNLKPIKETFAVVPWLDGVGRMICTVYRGADRFPKDPRYVAESLDAMLRSSGLRAFVSPELEFFIFDKVTVSVDTWRQFAEISSSEGYWANSQPFNALKEGYYVTYPNDKFEELKMLISETLEKFFGIDVEVFHHEVAGASQHEINFRGGEITSTGDAVQTVKYIIRGIASKKGFIATFMPKPLYGDNGSGMHVHVSIWRDGENLFYDPSDEYAGLSQYARYFIGGLIEHGRALSAIVSPTVNSYKRLVPGYEAPVYLVWSKANRSAAIRVPAYHKYNGNSKRIEYRPPDPTANPYLALSAIVLAGLDGVRKKIDPGDPIDENIYKMDPQRRKALGIKELPRSLDEALDELETDNEWLKPVYSNELIETYIELKREEVRKIQSYPSPIEIYSYINY